MVELPLLNINMSTKNQTFPRARETEEDLLDQKTLVVHLANDGYLYIQDRETETLQIQKPNDRHSSEPHRWAELKTSRRESAFKISNGLPANGSVQFLTARLCCTTLRLDVSIFAFRRKKAVSHEAKISLAIIFECDWPVTDESKLWFS
jgi:hypothetical protein